LAKLVEHVLQGLIGEESSELIALKETPGEGEIELRVLLPRDVEE
jgi:hypothetical protein